MRILLPVATLCLAFALPSGAAAAPRGDLQMRSVSSASKKTAPGAKVAAAATVSNATDRRVPASRLGFYLSRDRRKGKGDFRLRPRPLLRARKPRTRTKVVRTLTVPGGVSLGSYFLIGCADDTKRIRERREGNNCRSAKRRIQVVSAPPSVFTTPSMLVNGPPEGGLTGDTTPSFSGETRSPSAVIARVEAKLDTVPFSTSGINCTGCGESSEGLWTYTPTVPLQDGPHSFAFRAIDGSGRSSPTITRTLTVDATPPTFTSITAAPASSTVTATFSEPLACSTVNPFDFSATINGATVSVTDASCSAGGTAITFTMNSAPGAGASVVATLVGVVTDQAGNVAPTPTMRSDTA